MPQEQADLKSDDKECIICRLNVSGSQYHQGCYDDLCRADFKIRIPHQMTCFICQKEIVEAYSSYEPNDFIKFHIDCLSTWHSENGARRYQEKIFNKIYPDFVSKYYVHMDNNYIEINVGEINNTDFILTPDPDIGYEYQHSRRPSANYRIYAICLMTIMMAIALIGYQFF